MKNQQPIKYVLIGSVKTLQEIGEYPNKLESNTSKSAKHIFQGYCQNEAKIVYEQRHEIKNADEIFYFTVTSDKIFYLVGTESNYSSRDVWELISEIVRDNTHLLVDEKGELSKLGKQQLKTIVDSYQKQNSIGKLHAEVQEVKIELNQNYKKLVNNIDNMEDLQKKANNIKDISKEYNKEANHLKRVTWCQNFKWTIILVIVIIGILLLIIIPIVSSKRDRGGDKGNDDNQNPPHNQPPNQPPNSDNGDNGGNTPPSNGRLLFYKTQ